MYCLCFFKQKTAYEMRISDWSSDVCSSDLMEGLGIYSGADLAAKDMGWLTAHFGNSAEWLHNLARGIDHRRVRSNRPLKSLGGERTFFNDLVTDTEIREALAHVCTVVWDRAAKRHARGRTVTLELRYADFKTITRARSETGRASGRESVCEYV